MTLSASEPVAYVRVVPERADDFAFENDKVAFRVYGPALAESAENNGFDAWLKRVDYPIIDKWYRQHLEENKSYHKDWGEGYDPYKVGSSLGAGGMALWVDGKLAQPNVYQSYHIVENGPERVVFELTYVYEQVGIEELKTITLESGSQLFASSSQFTKGGEPIVVDVAVGVTTHGGKAKVSAHPEAGFVGTWEKIDDAYVGTGVIVPKAMNPEYVDYAAGSEDAHALLLTRTDDSGRITYYGGFAWSKAGDVVSSEQWDAYLRGFSAAMGSGANQ
jgi:hypothetical protein